MKITREIISDLFPLYVANECSADSRALIDEYLKANPREADELRRIVNATVPAMLPSAQLDEARSFREARRRVRSRSWLMGLAIFFSLAPFSFSVNGTNSWWLLRDAPKSALIYALMGALCWIGFAVQRRNARSL